MTEEDKNSVIGKAAREHAEASKTIAMLRHVFGRLASNTERWRSHYRTNQKDWLLLKRQ